MNILIKVHKSKFLQVMSLLQYFLLYGLIHKNDQKIMLFAIRRIKRWYLFKKKISGMQQVTF